MIKAAPSLLSADFTNLSDELKSLCEAGADFLHFDVMDGVFVPNISMGIPVLASISKATDLLWDIHLMIVQPEKYVDAFCKAGAGLLCFHIESDTPEGILRAIKKAKSNGVKCGLALKPATPAEALLPYIKEIDLALVMTVEPGFGGQTFMYDQLDKIAIVRGYINNFNPDCELEVDGGVNAETGALCKSKGANVLVAGTYVFKAPSRSVAINKLKES